jgi:Ca-activated chloride channel homolog
MDMLWPGFLVLLLLIPLLIAVYIWVLRRKRRFTVRYSSLALVRAALPRYSRLRRHLPFALFLAALASLIIAFGRPVAVVAVPTNQTVIVLAMDVSRSMCSNDIEPNRLIAAQAAANSFIQNQEASAHIGIVAFSGFAEVIQMPTTDTEALQAAINSLITGRRTAVGSAILKSIDVIAEVDETVAPSISEFSTEPAPVPVVPGAYVPNIIVLLTDGATNAGPLPLDAAQQAVDRGIRVYTIGFGTEFGGEFVNCGPQLWGREPFGGGGPGGGGGGPGGGGFRRDIDEETLMQIAESTGGKYYLAESGSELQDVFRELPTSLIVRHEATEISVTFVAVGALLVAVAIALSMLWHPLP